MTSRIPQTENGSGGAYLRNFYEANHLLPGDAFDITAQASGSVAIVGTGDFGDTTPNTQLATSLTDRGYSVTTSSTLPDNLAQFSTIYYVTTTDELSDADEARLVAFVTGGGGLYLTGERPCCEELNAQDTLLLSRVLRAPGALTVGNQGDVGGSGAASLNPSARGSIATTPTSPGSITMAAPGRISGVSGDNVYATFSGIPVAAVWDEGDVIGGGRVVLVMDINWLEPAYWDEATAQQNIQNIATFLDR